MNLNLSEFRVMSDIVLAVESMATVTLNGRTGSFTGEFRDGENFKASDDFEIEDLTVTVQWPGTKHSWPKFDFWPISEIFKMVCDQTLKIQGYATWHSS